MYVAGGVASDGSHVWDVSIMSLLSNSWTKIEAPGKLKLTVVNHPPIYHKNILFFGGDIKCSVSQKSDHWNIPDQHQQQHTLIPPGSPTVSVSGILYAACDCELIIVLFSKENASVWRFQAIDVTGLFIMKTLKHNDVKPRGVVFTPKAPLLTPTPPPKKCHEKLPPTRPQRGRKQDFSSNCTNAVLKGLLWKLVGERNNIISESGQGVGIVDRVDESFNIISTIIKGISHSQRCVNLTGMPLTTTDFFYLCAALSKQQFISSVNTSRLPFIVDDVSARAVLETVRKNTKICVWKFERTTFESPCLLDLIIKQLVMNQTSETIYLRKRLFKKTEKETDKLLHEQSKARYQKWCRSQSRLKLWFKSQMKSLFIEQQQHRGFIYIHHSNSMEVFRQKLIADEIAIHRNLAIKKQTSAERLTLVKHEYHYRTTIETECDTDSMNLKVFEQSSRRRLEDLSDERHRRQRAEKDVLSHEEKEVRVQIRELYDCTSIDLRQKSESLLLLHKSNLAQREKEEAELQQQRLALQEKNKREIERRKKLQQQQLQEGIDFTCYELEQRDVVKDEERTSRETFLPEFKNLKTIAEQATEARLALEDLQRCLSIPPKGVILITKFPLIFTSSLINRPLTNCEITFDLRLPNYINEGKRYSHDELSQEELIQSKTQINKALLTISIHHTDSGVIAAISDCPELPEAQVNNNCIKYVTPQGVISGEFDKTTEICTRNAIPIEYENAFSHSENSSESDSDDELKTEEEQVTVTSINISLSSSDSLTIPHSVITDILKLFTITNLPSLTQVQISISSSFLLSTSHQSPIITTDTFFYPNVPPIMIPKIPPVAYREGSGELRIFDSYLNTPSTEGNRVRKGSQPPGEEAGMCFVIIECCNFGRGDILVSKIETSDYVEEAGYLVYTIKTNITNPPENSKTILRCTATSVADILTSIKFFNTSRDPSEGVRSVFVSLRYGNRLFQIKNSKSYRTKHNRYPDVCCAINVGVIEINVIPKDDPTEIDFGLNMSCWRQLSGDIPPALQEYQLPQPPLHVAKLGYIRDVDTASYIGGWLSCKMTNGFKGDALSFCSPKVELRDNNEEPASVFVNNVYLGTVTLKDNSQCVIVHFTEESSLEMTSCCDLFQSLVFVTTAKPSPEARKVHIQAELKINGLISEASTTVKITQPLMQVPTSVATTTHREDTGPVRLATFEILTEDDGWDGGYLDFQFLEGHTCDDMLDIIAKDDLTLGPMQLCVNDDVTELVEQSDSQSSSPSAEEQRSTSQSRTSSIPSPGRSTSVLRDVMRTLAAKEVQDRFQNKNVMVRNMQLGVMQKLVTSQTSASRTTRYLSRNISVNGNVIAIMKQLEGGRLLIEFQSSGKKKDRSSCSVRRKDVASILKSVTYCNESQNPKKLRKVIEVTANDGLIHNSIAVVEIKLQIVEDATQIRRVEYDYRKYRQHSEIDLIGFLLLDDCTLFDPDTYSFNEGFISVTIVSGGTGRKSDSITVIDKEDQRRALEYTKKVIENERKKISNNEKITYSTENRLKGTNRLKAVFNPSERTFIDRNSNNEIFLSGYCGGELYENYLIGKIENEGNSIEISFNPLPVETTRPTCKEEASRMMLLSFCLFQN